MKRQVLSFIAVLVLAATVGATTKTQSAITNAAPVYTADTTPTGNGTMMQDSSSGRKHKGKMKSNKQSTMDSSSMGSMGDSTRR